MTGFGLHGCAQITHFDSLRWVSMAAIIGEPRGSCQRAVPAPGPTAPFSPVATGPRARYIMGRRVVAQALYP